MKIIATVFSPLLLLVLPNLCLAEQPARINWSSATQSYEFDTGRLFGCIEPYSWYHGIAGLMHRECQADAVRPRKAVVGQFDLRKFGLRAAADLGPSSRGW